MLQFIAKLFFILFSGFEVFIMDGNFGGYRMFVYFLSVSSAIVSRELLFNVLTLW